jgi:hypothetical protein
MRSRFITCNGSYAKPRSAETSGLEILHCIEDENIGSHDTGSRLYLGVETLQNNRPGLQRVMGFKALPPSAALLLTEKRDRLLEDHFIPCECSACA